MAIPGYRILRKIQQGGMSTVYLAIQKSVDREVAIKVMSPSLTSDPSFGSRFYREAKIVGKLSHPNIVSIYDVGSYKHYNYIAMDYLPGVPLQEKIRQGLSPQQVMVIVREMASALDYAHQRGYIHRDIKPDNILFRADGSSVLCDFGIAKALKGSIKMTSVGAVLGTPHYMSPEQAQGKNLDGRSDLYSLGVVCFEMLTGHIPYQGDDAIAVAVKHMSAPTPKLPANHKLFQKLINKLLAKKPGQRFQTGKELIDAIDALQAVMNKGSNSYLTQTNSTAIQVYGLVHALFTTLSSTLLLAAKRLFIGKLGLQGNAVQLSSQQLEQIDDFVLDDKESMINLGETTQSVATYSKRRWVYWPVALLATLLGGFVYLSEYQPKQLAEYYRQAQTLAGETGPLNTTTPLSSDQQTQLANKLAAMAASQAPAEEPPPLSNTVVKYPLTITADPSHAQIKILNIKPAYQDAIELEPGAYRIQVSAKDYHSETFWLKIEQQALTRHISLQPTRRLLPAGTVLNDPLRIGGKGPSMVILPLETLNVVEPSPYQLSLDEPIAVGQTEISFADYDSFAKATNRALPDDENWGRGSRPVINVSQQDAIQYAEWLSEQTGQRYRLPSAQEWEYAARGGTVENYWWGRKSKTENTVNCRSGCSSDWSKLFSSSTAPVGSYPANRYGLQEVAGNVAEWVADCKTTAEATCQTSWVGGGSHDDKASQLTSRIQETVDANSKTNRIGFRLVLEL